MTVEEVLDPSFAAAAVTDLYAGHVITEVEDAVG